MVFSSFCDLVKKRGLNNRVELKNLSMTQEQLDGLKDYLKSREALRICYGDVDTYKLKIVSSILESDLKLE